MPDPEKLPDKLICPECGKDVTDSDPWAHALDHWPERIPNPEQNAKAVERQKILRDWAKKKGLI